MGSPVRIMELLLRQRVRIPVSVNVLMGTLGLIVKQGLRLAREEQTDKLVKMEEYHCSQLLPMPVIVNAQIVIRV